MAMNDLWLVVEGKYVILFTIGEISRPLFITEQHHFEKLIEQFNTSKLKENTDTTFRHAVRTILNKYNPLTETDLIKFRASLLEINDLL